MNPYDFDHILRKMKTNDATTEEIDQISEECSNIGIGDMVDEYIEMIADPMVTSTEVNEQEAKIIDKHESVQRVVYGFSTRAVDRILANTANDDDIYDDYAGRPPYYSEQFHEKKRRR